MASIQVDVKRFMTEVKINLLRTNYWYGCVLMQIPFVYDQNICPTLGMGKKSGQDHLIKLYINPDYICFIIQRAGGRYAPVLAHFTEILRHEVHHLLFEHLSRSRPEKKIWDLACELAVNTYLDRSKLIPDFPPLPAGNFPEDYGLPDKLGTDEYYDLLLAGSRKVPVRVRLGGNGGNMGKQGKQKKQPSGGGGQQGSGQQGRDGTSSEQRLDSHDLWENAGDDPLIRVQVKNILRQANRSCRAKGSWGDLPAGIRKEIETADENPMPVVPWEVVLKDFLSSASETVLGYTMRRPSKRYGTRPGTKKEDVLTVAVGIDTSGSIENDMLKLFFNELYWIVKSGCRVTVFEWDTKVHREYDLRDFTGSVTGGGGTDPTDFLEKVSQRKFDCAIIFTDLIFPAIDKTAYPIPKLWVAVDPPMLDPEDPPVDGTIFTVNPARDGFVVAVR